MHCATVVLLSVTLLKVAGTGALSNNVTLLVIPPVVENGKDVELVCNYDLQGAPLLSLKFFTGHQEFYRFNPKDDPTVKVFPQPGMAIDRSWSRDNRVLLRSVDHSLAGNVSCEVSTGAPDFLTYIATQKFVVVGNDKPPLPVLTSSTPGTSGLSNNVTLMVIPSVVEKGKDVELVCNYDLQGAPLFSLKFFIGHQEFYRFNPKEVPTVELFPQPGIAIDRSRSRDNRVLLRSVDYSLAGNVSCEVSTGAPEFLTYIATQTIVVVGPGTSALSNNVTLLVIPPVVEKGKDVELVCNYDLQGAPLFALKFFTGHQEFYRFNPKEVPALKLFSQLGVSIDRSWCWDNQSRVLLRSVDHSLAGNVSCEVSTGAPEFLTYIATQAIVVVEPNALDKLHSTADASDPSKSSDTKSSTSEPSA